jgi:hypothetical protein
VQNALAALNVAGDVDSVDPADPLERSAGTVPALPRANLNPRPMNRLFAALGAGWGAKKLGGGCFTTVLIFLLLYWLLRNI